MPIGLRQADSLGDAAGCGICAGFVVKGCSVELPRPLRFQADVATTGLRNPVEPRLAATQRNHRREAAANAEVLQRRV